MVVVNFVEKCRKLVAEIFLVITIIIVNVNIKNFFFLLFFLFFFVFFFVFFVFFLFFLFFSEVRYVVVLLSLFAFLFACISIFCRSDVRSISSSLLRSL